jgi:hypothetical protein
MNQLKTLLIAVLGIIVIILVIRMIDLRKTLDDKIGNSSPETSVGGDSSSIDDSDESSLNINTVSDQFIQDLSIGMNPEYIREQIGSPQFIGSIELSLSNKEVWKTRVWHYNFDDLRLRILGYEDRVVAYTVEVYHPDRVKVKPRKIPLNHFCSEVVLGESTFDDYGSCIASQLKFGNFRNWIVLAKCLYGHAACGGGTAYISTGDYEYLAGVPSEDWSDDPDYLYTAIEDPRIDELIVYSVTYSINLARAPRLGFILHPPTY